jgi:serine/threonine protein kinase
MEPPTEREPSEQFADELEGALEALWRGDSSRFDRLVDSDDADAPGLGAVMEGVAREHAAGTLTPPVSRKIAGYTLQRVLASGGMGTVYLAVQDHPHRVVALKVMKAGIASRSALRRFEYESQVLARLRHPNIAQVYEAGAHREGGASDLPGVPFFAMEYVPDAKPITDYARLRNLATRQRLELFLQVCDAVHHGHQKGIIHRDLKPANLLVDPSGRPKVIDFGVARSTDSDMAVTTLQTEVGQLIGTLQYMSPEQCDADPHNVDVRSDVYALGAVLYELLCGRLPYEVAQATMFSAAKIIREEPPVRPSAANRAIRGDIETITLKALEKEPDRRYGSAAELSDDIRRYLRNVPIVARAPSVLYHLKMFARRHRAAVGFLAATFLVLAAASVVSLLFAMEAFEARDNLEIVAEFQQSVLSDVDPERMGSAIIAEQQERLRENLLADGASSEEVEAVMTSFGEQVRSLNPTNVARRVLDEEVLGRAAARIETDFANQPLVEASLRQAIGNTYLSLGLYPQAEPHTARALEIRRDELGDDHADTLRSLDDMAELLWSTGRVEESLAHRRRVLEGRRRVLGAGHPDALDSTSEVRRVLWFMGRYDEALVYCREALEGRRRVLGAEHPDALESAANMGLLLAALGRHDEALASCREALEGRRRVLGAEHPDTLNSMAETGRVLKDMGRAEEARQYDLEAMAGHRRILEGEPPDASGSRGRMADLHLGVGRYEEALTYQRQALEDCRRRLGDDHPQTLIAVNNVGVILRRVGRYDEALAYQRRAVEGYRRVLGDDHPETLKVLSNLGFLLEVMGRYEAALACCREALDGAARSPEENRRYAGLFLARYGRVLADLGRYAEAERALLEGHAIEVRVAGAGHERTIAAIRWLVDLYVAWYEAEPDKGCDRKADEWRARLPSAPDGSPQE